MGETEERQSEVREREREGEAKESKYLFFNILFGKQGHSRIQDTDFRCF